MIRKALAFATIIALLFTNLSGWATTYTVKSGGGGNYTTIQACANAMSAGDQCTVYAGIYNETVSTGSGTSGNYKTFTVNASDVVVVNGFTLNSHVKVIGNCPNTVLGTADSFLYGTCGFSINGGLSGSGTCISGTTNMTDYIVTNDAMISCSSFVTTGSNGSNSSLGVIKNNFMAWSASPFYSTTVSMSGGTATFSGTFPSTLGNTSLQTFNCSVSAYNGIYWSISANTTSTITATSSGVSGLASATGCLAVVPNVSTTAQLRGNNILWMNNDVSHVSDGPYLSGDKPSLVDNNFHDTNSLDCGSNSSNCHIDFMQADANYNGGALATTHVLIEKNRIFNMGGSDVHAIGLYQGEACSGNCFNAINRFNQAYHVTGAGVVNDNSTSACPAWDHVKTYNNTWVDMASGSGSGVHNTSYCSTNSAYVNEIYYWPSSVSNLNAYYTTGGGGSSTSPYTVGSNLAYCPGCTSSSIYPHSYGTGLWTADSGNILSNPLFNNYSSNDFSLTSSSPARNAGKALTTVNGTISSSASLVVSDPDYFQDGQGISQLVGDCIKVSSLSNSAVCITAVNYSTSTLTLASAISATNGDPVWLYSIADGTQVLTDSSGPDLGAIPYASTPQAATPTASPVAGSYGSTQTVTLSDSTPSSTITYCTDTVNTCTPGTTYSSAITVSSSGYIRAFATASGYTQSSTASFQYTIGGAPGSVPASIRLAVVPGD